MNLLAHYFETSHTLDAEPLLWRKQLWEHFQTLGLPSRKKEAFQYVPLQHLTFPPLHPENRLADHFRTHNRLPSSVLCLPLNEAMHSYSLFFQNRLTHTVQEEKDPFAALNGALHQEGLFLYVPPGVSLSHPLEWETHLTQATWRVSRLHLYLAPGAEVHLSHSLHGEGDGNVVIDCLIDQGAKCFLHEEQKVGPSSTLFCACRARLKRGAHLDTLFLQQGAKVARTSLVVQLAEEESRAQLRGLATLSSTRQQHLHARVEHLAPNATSRQHFKAVLQEESVASFEGKIVVEPMAQKTESYQLYNALLLSDRAQVFVKPNLEIGADDVKASHGATIGQLSEEELFYLHSRGLSPKEAEHHLIQAFCQEMK